jgi:NhaA family Na+:H+ antiporter
VTKPITSIGEFFELDSAGGILLVAAAVLAMLFANMPVSIYYDLLIEVPVTVAVAEFQISKPLLLWINDGLMAVFFLYVGLELKREILEGELSEVNKVVLPVVGAIGGMLVPAGIYLLFTFHDPVAIKGWAIPAATDIAFALGILALLGSRVPASLKVFLTSLAIIDDLGAILIIALFYAGKISVLALLFAAFCMIILFVLNRFRVNQISPYLLIGLLMWIALLKSGVHATLSGVILAMFIPLQSQGQDSRSLLKELEHDLHSVVAFFILPVFAFANAGVNLRGVTMELILHDVTIAIACGLFIGKQLGIFLFCWLAVKTGLARLPDSMSYRSLYGTAVLCGIGFTMSLFIGSLAFEETGVGILFDERVGIIAGSLCSGILGYLILRSALQEK